jgi:hypothetical protein
MTGPFSWIVEESSEFKGDSNGPVVVATRSVDQNQPPDFGFQPDLVGLCL